MHFMDRVFLSWHSTAAVAASMPAGMLYFSLLCCPLGIASYVTTFIAQYFGANRPDRIGLALWQGIWIGLAAVPLFVLFVPFAPTLFSLAGHEPDVAKLETTYFQVVAFGGGAAVMAAALGSFFTGLGHARVVMLVNLVGSLLNIVLNWILIFGHFGVPEMGIAGAALGTVISEWAKVAIFGWVLNRSEFAVPYSIHAGRRWDGELFWRLIRFGGPSGLQMFIETTAFTIFLFQLGTLGADALAATTISFGINSLAFVPMLGLGMAVTTLVGQQLGANAPELAERATRTSFVLGAAYTSLWAVAYWFVPDVFLAAYSLGDDPVRQQEVHAMCVLLLRFIAFYSFLDMTHIVFVSAIKGAGDTRFVLLTTILIAPIPIILGWLGTSVFHWTLVHFWMVITSWICTIGVIYFLRYQFGPWRTMRVIEDSVWPESLASSQVVAGNTNEVHRDHERRSISDGYDLTT